MALPAPLLKGFADDNEALAQLVAQAVVERMQHQLRTQLGHLEARLDARFEAFAGHVPRFKASRRQARGERESLRFDLELPSLPAASDGAGQPGLSSKPKADTKAAGLWVSGREDGDSAVVPPEWQSDFLAAPSTSDRRQSNQNSPGGGGESAFSAAMEEASCSGIPCWGPLGHIGPVANYVKSLKFSLPVSLGVVFYLWAMIQTCNEFLAIEYDEDPSEGLSDFAFISSHCLCIAMTVEVALQLLVYGTAVVRFRFLWFAVDVAGMTALWLDLAAFHELLPWYLFVHLPRAMLGMKVFRLLMIFPDLGFILGCLYKSMSTFSWAALLLGYLLLMVAYFFETWVVTFKFSTPLDSPDFLKVQELVEFLPSVGATMLVLVQAVTGGVDWGEVYDKLRVMGNTPAGFFVAFVLFVQLNAFNVATGIFVNKSLEVEEEVRAEVGREMTGWMTRMTRRTTSAPRYWSEAGA